MLFVLVAPVPIGASFGGPLTFIRRMTTSSIGKSQGTDRYQFGFIDLLASG
jgi:hypothetical protein